MGGLGAMVDQCHHPLHKDSPTPKFRIVLVKSQALLCPQQQQREIPKGDNQPFQSTYYVPITVSVVYMWHLIHAERVP